MNDVTIDRDVEATLGARGGDVDSHIHHLADVAYGISQQLVPQPGRPNDPYATGRLKASGKVQRGPGLATWEVEYGTDHAIYVELGTRYMHAEPYLRPALLAAVRHG
jgi:hypothetical protein